MAGVFYEPAFAVLIQWFVRERQRAFTLMTFIAGLASLIFNPLSSWLIGAQGWRAALVTLAGLLAIELSCRVRSVLRRRPADLGLQPDGAVDVSRADGQKPARLMQPVSHPAQPFAPAPSGH